MSDEDITREYSAGGVVYRRTADGLEIALVGRNRYNDWSLPKGHIEKGESREQAAIREVKEETGLDARILQKIDKVVYFYRRAKGDLIRKTVYHFLMETDGYDLRDPNWEVSEIRWVPITEAGNVLSYENDKKVVEKARATLEQREHK